MDKKIYLTSSEMATLWNNYMNESLSKSILGFMLKDIKDMEIKEVVQQGYDISNQHIERLLTIFEAEQFAVPNGFTEEDVYSDAPWLFTDIFCLTYVNHMAKLSMLAFSGLISMCARKDIREYMTQAIVSATTLYNLSLDTALSKGVSARHPYIGAPNETDYIDSKKYFSGLNPFSEKRPLNAIEISYLYQNISTNSIGHKLCLAFAQTSPTKDVQDFMLRCSEVSKKHMQIFGDILLKDDIQAPQVPDVGVSHSTTQTFSDKLMMFHMSLIMAAGIGNNAVSAATSQRSDLMVNYERLSLEVSKLAKSGADIMIKHQWLEQPPGMKNRKKLAKEKGGN